MPQEGKKQLNLHDGLCRRTDSFEIGNVGICSKPVAHRMEPDLAGGGTKPEAADLNAFAGTMQLL